MIRLEHPEPYLAYLDWALTHDPQITSAETRRGYRRAVRQFEQWRTIHWKRVLTRPVVEAYVRERQMAGQSRATLNHLLAALRWWARSLLPVVRNLDVPSAHREQLERGMLEVANMKEIAPPQRDGEATTAGAQPLTEAEINTLLTCCADGTLTGQRDGALLAMACATGARRAELAALTVADCRFYADEAGAWFTEVCIQPGPEAQSRHIVLNSPTSHILLDWLAVRGDAPGALFCALHKGNRLLPTRHLSGEALRLILTKRAQQAGVTLAGWHSFRRTVVETLLDQQVELRQVQELLGHAWRATTRLHQHRWAEARRPADV